MHDVHLGDHLSLGIVDAARSLRFLLLVGCLLRSRCLVFLDQLRLPRRERVDLLSCLHETEIVLLLQLGADLVEGEQGGCPIDIAIGLCFPEVSKTIRSESGNGTVHYVNSPLLFEGCPGWMRMA